MAQHPLGKLETRAVLNHYEVPSDMTGRGSGKRIFAPILQRKQARTANICLGCDQCAAKKQSNSAAWSSARVMALKLEQMTVSA